jgi:dihydrofolate reductase
MVVDEFLFVVHPVSIGKGLALFDTLSKPLHLSLLNTTRSDSGVVVNAYRPTSA